jgi:hypothetical protein
MHQQQLVEHRPGPAQQHTHSSRSPPACRLLAPQRACQHAKAVCKLTDSTGSMNGAEMRCQLHPSTATGSCPAVLCVQAARPGLQHRSTTMRPDVPLLGFWAASQRTATVLQATALRMAVLPVPGHAAPQPCHTTALPPAQACRTTALPQGAADAADAVAACTAVQAQQPVRARASRLLSHPEPLPALCPRHVAACRRASLLPSGCTALVTRSVESPRRVRARRGCRAAPHRC